MRPFPLLCTLFGFLPALAAAQTTVDFQVDDARAQLFGVDPTAAEQELSQTLTEALQLADPSRFMVSMAEAASIAGKGMGVDYASNPSKFVFGMSLGTGANANGLVLDRDPQSLPAGGFSAQTSAMVGVNLGLLAGTASDEGMAIWDRFTVSAHGMSFKSPFADRGFRGFMTNYGGHVTIKVIGKGESGVWDWGGLDVTTGYEHATYRLDFTGNTPFSAGDDLTWDATGRYVLTSNADSIPFELSSNIRVSVITLFAGAGLDLNVAETLGDGSITGPIRFQTNSGPEEIGTGTITNVASGEAEPFAIRGFGGIQLNILPLKLYAGIQGSSRASASLQAGIRLAQ
jgi:hypothetical protein